MTEREIFLEALEMSTPEARAAYLQGACGRDGTLRRKVEELLREHFSNDTLIAGPAVEAEGKSAETGIGEAPAALVGRYKLLEKVGEGGFGEVWMAEQREPVKRRVALKIIKPGMDSRQVVARFEAERQALAMMDHPNIARVLEGGATETGRPYFVMELVRGIKITEYCDKNRLPTRDRLELFVHVCHAIQHAHQKGIIHRDIKPSNVLVTLHDGVPVPKVIDFGIAKATQQELTDKTLFTQFQQFIGTPAYISPEQAEMSGLDIDTRADIYSLGVLLYELLVGQTPFDAKEMIQGGLDALRRIIREKEPLRPSTKLNTLEGDARTTAGKCRQTDVGRLVHQLQGDLDWIVMKCLEKDRVRRYETANGLATEIKRYLSNEPVLARPPNNLYRFQKLVRRNKLAFTAAGLVVTALVLGLAVSSWLFIRERRARQETRIEALKSEQVAHFLEQMLQSVGPSVAQGRDTALLREVLDRTADRIGPELKSQPLVEAELRSTIGEVYRALGDSQKAETTQRQALDLRRELLGNSHPAVASSLDYLARALWKNRKYPEAEAAEREALAIRRKLFGNDNLEVATSLFYLGRVLINEKNFAEAERAYREALAIRKKLLGDGHSKVAESQSQLAEVLLKVNRAAEAGELSRQAMDITTRSAKPHSSTIDRVQANILEKQGKVAEAEKIRREELDRKELILGLEHPDVATSLSSLSKGYKGSGQVSNAIVLAEKAFQSLKSKFGETNSQTLSAFANLAELYGRARRLAELTALEKDLKGDDLVLEGMPKALHSLGFAYRSCGSYEDSLRVFEKAFQSLKSKFGETNSQTLSAFANLAELYGRARRLAELTALEKDLKGDDLAEEGMPKALHNLGFAYRDCGSHEDSLRVFRRAAEMGDAHCTAHVGDAYENGLGVRRDPKEALKWYIKSAELGGYLWSFGHVAGMYEGGSGTAKNMDEAIKWLTRGAEAGATDSQIALARIYRLGQGCATNLAEAAKWYEKAATAGNPTGLIGLLLMAHRGQIAESPDRIEQQMNKVADQADANFMYTLARLYETGEGLPKDLVKAAWWNAKATENPRADQLNKLAWSLATSFDNGVRNGTKAVAFAETAVAATSRTNANYLDTLAAAYAETGDFEKAVSIQKEAVSLVPSNEKRSIYEAHLKLFENQKPCRE